MGFPEISAAFGAMVVTTTTYDEDGNDKVEHFKMCGAFAAMMAMTTHAHDGCDTIPPYTKRHGDMSEMMVMTTTHNNDDDDSYVEHRTSLRGNSFYVQCDDFGMGSRNVVYTDKLGTGNRFYVYNDI